jgi:hypothetical protein
MSEKHDWETHDDDMIARIKSLRSLGDKSLRSLGDLDSVGKVKTPDGSFVNVEDILKRKTCKRCGLTILIVDGFGWNGDELGGDYPGCNEYMMEKALE